MINIKEMKKSEKSDYFNGLNGINQVLKHTFKSFYLDDRGNVISDIPDIEMGKHKAITELHKYIPVPENCNLRIDSKRLFVAISQYKKYLEELVVDTTNNTVYFKLSDDKENILIGRIVEPVNDILLYNNANDLDNKFSLSDKDVDRLLNKEVIVKKCDDKPMILSHKLFPNMKKSESNAIYISEIDDKYFISSFLFKYNIENSSGKKIYSQVIMIHAYKFLKF